MAQTIIYPPITGSITASNASVATTGASVPAGATYIGANVGGVLTGLVATANGLKVDGSGATQPVSGTVAATQSGGWTVSQSGSWTVIPSNTPNTTPWLMTINNSGVSAAVTGSNALKVDGSAVTQPASQSGTWTVQPGNTANTTAWLIDQVATTSATFQDGSIAGTSLTASFATVITTGGALKNVGIRNNTDKTVVVSLNGGTTTSFTLDAGDQIFLDLKENGLNIPNSTALQAKHGGSVPTTGSIRINGVY